MLQLIPEWRSSYKFTSVQAGLLLGLFDAAYAAGFWGLQDKLDVTLFGFINAVVSFVIIPWLRNIQQSPVVPPEVKKEMQAKVDDLPTTKPDSYLPQRSLPGAQPNKLSGQDARDWIVKEVRLQVAEALKPKPRKPRKKAPPPPDTGGTVRAP